MQNDRQAQRLVTEVVDGHAAVRLEELTGLLPQLSWNQIFQAVDELSRRSAILLRRRGFEYEICSLPR